MVVNLTIFPIRMENNNQQPVASKNSDTPIIIKNQTIIVILPQPKLYICSYCKLVVCVCVCVSSLVGLS